MPTRLSQEVANASKVLANELPNKFVKSGYTDVLVATAKKLERLQNRRRKVRKELKTLNEDIRLAKRELKALAQQIGRGE